METAEYKANIALNRSQEQCFWNWPRFVFVPFWLATGEQPLKVPTNHRLPKDMYPLASKTEGNAPGNKSIWYSEILIDTKEPRSIIVTSFRSVYVPTRRYTVLPWTVEYF